jgi:hypothetical protein
MKLSSIIVAAVICGSCIALGAGYWKEAVMVLVAFFLGIFAVCADPDVKWGIK